MDAETLQAIASIIAAFGVPTVAVFTYLGLRKGKQNEKGIGEVHEIVNSQNKALVDVAKAQGIRIESLVTALLEAGIELPSLPPKEDT